MFISLVLLFLQPQSLEQKRVESILNPPSETIGRDLCHTHLEYVAITNRYLVEDETKHVMEVGLDKGKRVIIVNKKDLIKDNMRSHVMMPVYHRDKTLIVVSKNITIRLKSKEDIDKIIQHATAKNMRVDRKGKEVELRFTDDCPFVTVHEAARYFGELPFVERSEVYTYSKTEK